MSKECKHPTCGETCRREKKQKKIYRIPQTSKSRNDADKIYIPLAKKFRLERPICEAQIPGICTRHTQCVHHVYGKIGWLYTWVPGWMATCFACNGWIEDHDAEARRLGLKKSKFNIKPE